MTVRFTLHLGLHKTATTALQELVFPYVSDATYIGKCNHIKRLRLGPELSDFIKYLQPNPVAFLDRLPLAAIHFYLSLVQDKIILKIATSGSKAKDLDRLLALNAQMIACLDARGPDPQILLSQENLLNHSYGHVALDRTDAERGRHSVPLAYWRAIFPGKVQRAVMYVRDPLTYLYSRYVQIHSLRIERGNTRVVTPRDYLQVSGTLLQSPFPSSSIFYHIYPARIVADFGKAGIPIVMRSYEQHLLSGQSVAAEFAHAFQLSLHHPDRVDRSFATTRLNTTSVHKEQAMQLLLRECQVTTTSELKELFMEEARRHPIVQKALRDYASLSFD